MKLLLIFIYTNITAVLLIWKKERLQSGKSFDNTNRGEKTLIDYDEYDLNTREVLLYTSLAGVFIFLVTFIFYRSISYSLLFLPICLLYPRQKKYELIKKRKQALKGQFRDMLYALSTSLSAGKSFEMSFSDVLKDLQILYPHKNTPIIREVEVIVAKLKMNESVEKVLVDFAERAHIEEIDNFVDVLVIAKRSGGNLVAVMKNAADIIDDKMHILKEIDTLLAQRKLEQKILCVMPLLMIQLITSLTGDYMTPVFQTIFGRIIMTIAMLCCVISYFITKRIISIEV